ncbi:hypothetical protein Aperf_G00000059566 [Anoplocephala perfoliata]
MENENQPKSTKLTPRIPTPRSGLRPCIPSSHRIPLEHSPSTHSASNLNNRSSRLKIIHPPPPIIRLPKLPGTLLNPDKDAIVSSLALQPIPTNAVLLTKPKDAKLPVMVFESTPSLMAMLNPPKVDVEITTVSCKTTRISQSEGLEGGDEEEQGQSTTKIMRIASDCSTTPLLPINQAKERSIRILRAQSIGANWEAEVYNDPRSSEQNKTISALEEVTFIPLKDVVRPRTPATLKGSEVKILGFRHEPSPRNDEIDSQNSIETNEESSPSTNSGSEGNSTEMTTANGSD